MGEIPERSLFNQPEYRTALAPYFELTKAVRSGDMQAFSGVVSSCSDTFKKDQTLTLIQRLAHNVVKAGLRRISISYSRIKLSDVSTKLLLPAGPTTEYICAKAIRDGVIDATIDHDEGVLMSNEAIDLYATEEPQRAFHARIGFAWMCTTTLSRPCATRRCPGVSPKSWAAAMRRRMRRPSRSSSRRWRRMTSRR